MKALLKKDVSDPSVSDPSDLLHHTQLDISPCHASQKDLTTHSTDMENVS